LRRGQVARQILINKKIARPPSLAPGWRAAATGRTQKAVSPPVASTKGLRVVRQRLEGRASPCPPAVAWLRCHDALNFAKSEQSLADAASARTADDDRR